MTDGCKIEQVEHFTIAHKTFCSYISIWYIVITRTVIVIIRLFSSNLLLTNVIIISGTYCILKMQYLIFHESTINTCKSTTSLTSYAPPVCMKIAGWIKSSVKNLHWDIRKKIIIQFIINFPTFVFNKCRKFKIKNWQQKETLFLVHFCCQFFYGLCYEEFFYELSCIKFSLLYPREDGIGEPFV